MHLLRRWQRPGIACSFRRRELDHIMPAIAVLQNQQPNFGCMENTMRAFAAKGVSYHGGLFYSGSTLTQYRFPSGAKLPDWTDCPESMDFIAREVLALRIVWHVAKTFLNEFVRAILSSVI